MKKPKSLPVTAVAEVFVCERRVYLKSKFGERTTPANEKRKAVGNELHKKAFEQKTPASPDNRCYIATSLYGQDASETNRLRAFRDRSLMPLTFGRLLVAIYYRTSPHLVQLSARRSWLSAALRVVVNLALRVIK